MVYIRENSSVHAVSGRIIMDEMKPTKMNQNCKITFVWTWLYQKMCSKSIPPKTTIYMKEFRSTFSICFYINNYSLFAWTTNYTPLCIKYLFCYKPIFSTLSQVSVPSIHIETITWPQQSNRFNIDDPQFRICNCPRIKITMELRVNYKIAFQRGFRGRVIIASQRSNFDKHRLRERLFLPFFLFPLCFLF